MQTSRETGDKSTERRTQTRTDKKHIGAQYNRGELRCILLTSTPLPLFLLADRDIYPPRHRYVPHHKTRTSPTAPRRRTSSTTSRRRSPTTTRGIPRMPSHASRRRWSQIMHARSVGRWIAVIQTVRTCKVGITLRIFIYRTSCDLTAFFWPSSWKTRVI